MYVVCQTPRCQQTYPISELATSEEASKNIKCEKCGGVVTDENGNGNISQHDIVIPVADMSKLQKGLASNSEDLIKKGTLLVANEDGQDFDLTPDKVYKAADDQGVGTFPDCILIENDEGKVDGYSLDYFILYKKEDYILVRRGDLD